MENIVEEAKYEEKENEDGTKEQVEVSPRMEKAKIVKRPVALNDTTRFGQNIQMNAPMKNILLFLPQGIPGLQRPLFWIHLNMDYPFNLKGILYFPKDQHGIRIH